jgi:hypothetical protein
LVAGERGGDRPAAAEIEAGIQVGERARAASDEGARIIGQDDDVLQNRKAVVAEHRKAVRTENGNALDKVVERAQEPEILAGVAPAEQETGTRTIPAIGATDLRVGESHLPALPADIGEPDAGDAFQLDQLRHAFPSAARS